MNRKLKKRLSDDGKVINTWRAIESSTVPVMPIPKPMQKPSRQRLGKRRLYHRAKHFVSGRGQQWLKAATVSLLWARDYLQARAKRLAKVREQVVEGAVVA